MHYVDNHIFKIRTARSREVKLLTQVWQLEILSIWLQVCVVLTTHPYLLPVKHLEQVHISLLFKYMIIVISNVMIEIIIRVSLPHPKMIVNVHNSWLRWFPFFSFFLHYSSCWLHNISVPALHSFIFIIC